MQKVMVFCRPVRNYDLTVCIIRTRQGLLKTHLVSCDEKGCGSSLRGNGLRRIVAGLGNVMWTSAADAKQELLSVSIAPTKP